MALGLIIACQAYISTEVAVTLTLALAIGLLLGVAFAAGMRRRLTVPIVSGYALAGVVAAPIGYYGAHRDRAGLDRVPVALQPIR